MRLSNADIPLLGRLLRSIGDAEYAQLQEGMRRCVWVCLFGWVGKWVGGCILWGLAWVAGRAWGRAPGRQGRGGQGGRVRAGRGEGVLCSHGGARFAPLLVHATPRRAGHQWVAVHILSGRE